MINGETLRQRSNWNFTISRPGTDDNYLCELRSSPTSSCRNIKTVPTLKKTTLKSRRCVEVDKAGVLNAV